MPSPPTTSLTPLLSDKYSSVLLAVLMNLLIAMMGSTYAKVMEESEAKWRLQFADLIMLAQAEASSK